MTTTDFGHDHEPDEDAEREALAARVNATPPPPRPYDEVAEEAAEAALTDCQRQLVALRHQRTAATSEARARISQIEQALRDEKASLAEHIQELVAQEARLVKVVGAFRRSRPTSPNTNEGDNE